MYPDYFLTAQVPGDVLEPVVDLLLRGAGVRDLSRLERLTDSHEPVDRRRDGRGKGVHLGPGHEPEPEDHGLQGIGPSMQAAQNLGPGHLAIVQLGVQLGRGQDPSPAEVTDGPLERSDHKPVEEVLDRVRDEVPVDPSGDKCDRGEDVDPAPAPLCGTRVGRLNTTLHHRG